MKQGQAAAKKKQLMLDYKLVVTEAFGGHEKGEVISNAVEIGKILESENAGHVRKTGG